MRFPGGKGKTFHHVINLLPPHRRYIETHLGGGAVLRHKKPALRSIGIDRDPAVVERWRSELPGIADIRRADAARELETLDLGRTDLLYVDPPYLPETRQRQRVYRYDYTEADHIELLELLLAQECLVVISGYPSKLYECLLREWNRYEYTAKTHSGVRTEVLWFNYDVPTELHDSRYLGSSFREREAIHRRLTRLKGRVSRLSPVEQSVILGHLTSLRRERQCKQFGG